MKEKATKEYWITPPEIYMKTKDVIAQAEKGAGELLSELYTLSELEKDTINSAFKSFLSSYTKDLLQSVVEMAENMKIIMPDKKPFLSEEEMVGYNEALSDIIKEI